MRRRAPDGVLTRPPTGPRYRLGDAPRGDVFLPPLRELPVHTTPVAPSDPFAGRHPAWEFVAAHGGSGAGLLARLSAWRPFDAVGSSGGQADAGGGGLPPFGLNAGRAWPDPRLEPTPLVIVVAQTTMRGLGCARDAAAQHLAGRTPAGLRLVGLVTIADQPGRLPPPLAAARNLLTGAYPHSWHIPYVPAYRLLTGLPGEECPPIHPAVADVLAAIRSILTPPAPLKGHS